MCKESSLYEIAWNKLYQVFGEQLNQEALEVMDGVLKGVELEVTDKITMKEEIGNEQI